MPLLTVYMRIC